jgi:xanthine/CO dehydrogenase XdhC/CoxF family maturation factor
MADLQKILPLWRELEANSMEYVLATVVAVEGSSYRKPGACMLLAPDGRRAGTVSGGCLEAQVASRAWWLTSDGPTVQRYSTVEEDGDLPYGSGCGGVIHLLLERRQTAGPLLAALEEAFDRRVPLAVATILEGKHIGHRAFIGLEQHSSESLLSNDDSIQAQLEQLAQAALVQAKSIEATISMQGNSIRAWTNFRPARTGLWIFGAGDDAKPLLSLAKELGWFVAVADGRSNLATRERFPLADTLSALEISRLPELNRKGPGPAFAGIQAHDAAVILTHSFEQDSRILASLLMLDKPPAYIGVLGPQRRTRELLAEVASLFNLSASPTYARKEEWIDQMLSEMHAPMGLDLGAESPETIAFSILAEIQQSLAAASALPLREVRNSVQTIRD